ncbi:MAG TPA: glycosyltransferase family 2 protein [Candidatus Saccharimonadales bacterium]|nr:glycosyltransferase family 2 protein [Candidatus Saccharimonadales bacterium]
MKAVVILPTYNEKDNVWKIIPFLEDEVFPKIKDHEMAILVADDNSPDGTADEVRKLQKKYKNIEISQGPKNGLGAAYVRGMAYATEKMNADILFEMDADGQHDPTKIPNFLKEIDKGADMVLGTRYSAGGSIPANWPPQRKAFSIVANLLVRTIFMRFNVHDWTGGYRALKKEVFLKERKELENFNGYIFQISFLHKVLRDGFTVAEVPFHFSDRTLGQSKIAPLGYIIDVLTFVITARITELATGSFGKFLVVGGLGFVINFVVLWFFHNVYKMDPFFANLIGAALAIFSNFNFNNLWTFKEQKIHGIVQYLWKLVQFYATSAFGVIFIQSGTIFIGDLIVKPDVIFHLGPIQVKFYILYFLLGTFFILIWNYFIYSKFIWRKKK